MNRYRELPHGGTKLEHIAENLRHLFGTKRGNSGLPHDFGVGLPETHADAIGATRQLLHELLTDVTRYEKRLERPVLKTVGRSEDLCRLLLLSGYVDGQKVSFRLRYSPIYGRMDVEAADAE